MQPRYQATRAAIDLIKRFEGFRSRAARLPDGRWTIGYGHTRTAREGAQISEADADALLIYDVSAVITAINEWVFSPLSQNQFDSLTAFAFNIGLPNFRRSSVLRRLNEGAPLQAACAMEMWRTADFEGETIVIDALVRRRAAEMALFLTPQEGHIPVPSLIVMPRVDGEQARAAPMSAAEVAAALEGEIAAAFRTSAPEPSAALAAADSIAARLSAILQDHGPEAGPIAPPSTEALEAALYGAAPAEPKTAVEPPPAAALESAADMTPMAFTISGAPPQRRARSYRRGRASSPMVAAMGLAGLGVVGAGVFWGFSASAAPRLPLLPDPLTTGWGLSLIGALLVALSVYILLTRLGAKADAID